MKITMLGRSRSGGREGVGNTVQLRAPRLTASSSRGTSIPAVASAIRGESSRQSTLERVPDFPRFCNSKGPVL
jgi:hypothetical protein